MFLATRDPMYLEKLILYNKEDIVNLKTLAEYAVPRLGGLESRSAESAFERVK